MEAGQDELQLKSEMILRKWIMKIVLDWASSGFHTVVRLLAVLIRRILLFGELAGWVVKI
jgi:hypothetical protein